MVVGCWGICRRCAVRVVLTTPVAVPHTSLTREVKSPIAIRAGECAQRNSSLILFVRIRFITIFIRSLHLSTPIQVFHLRKSEDGTITASIRDFEKTLITSFHGFSSW